MHRSSENYPTHELGPICNMLNINRGNRMLTLSSVASKAKGLHEFSVRVNGPEHPVSKADIVCGDIITTIIKCAHGETILLRLDDTLPVPKSFLTMIRGTHGMYSELGNFVYFDQDGNGFTRDHVGTPFWDTFNEYMERYDHPLWKAYQADGVRAGHGGADYLTVCAFLDSVEHGTKPPIDVYDAAAMMSITCLSEQSIAMGGMPVAIPDFTNGLWLQRDPDPKSRYSLDAIHHDLF